MSTNERRREERDKEWRDFIEIVKDTGATPNSIRCVLEQAVILARAHAAVVVLDGEYDRHYPFPPEDEE